MFEKGSSVNLNQMRAMLKEFKALGLEKERIRSSLEAELKLDPNCTDNYVKLGIYYLSLDDMHEALKNLKKATLLKPGNEYLWFIQGYIYERAKLYKNAFEAYYFAYRLGSVMGRNKLLSFVQSELSTGLDPKEKELVEKFRESIC